MGWRVVKQPDGRYAIFSEIVDCFTIMNLTRDEMIEECVEEVGRRDAEAKVQRADEERPDPRDRIGADEQYTRWEEALDIIKRVHGEMHCRAVVVEPTHPGSHAAREEYERARRRADAAAQESDCFCPKRVDMLLHEHDCPAWIRFGEKDRSKPSGESR